MIVLPYILFAASCGLFFAAWWHARLARRHRRLFEALQRESLACNDPLRWPQHAWPLLAEAGVAALSWQGHWFGHAVEGRLGKQNARGHWSASLIDGADVTLSAQAAHDNPYGEARWLTQQAWLLFLLHWRMLLREQEKALQSALLQRAEHALLLKHELRNFAQWVEWTMAELAAVAHDEPALLRVARRLAAQADAVRSRAQWLAARSTIAIPEPTQPPADLAALVSSAADYHGLCYVLQGSAVSRTPASVWIVILDNLFSNTVREYRQQRIAAPVPLQLDQDSHGQARLRLLLPTGMQFGVPVAQLFEPLRSNQTGGSGLGLYLARKTAMGSHGALRATTAPAGFELTLP